MEVTLQYYSGFTFGEEDEGERQVKRAFILISDLLIFFTEMHVCSFFQRHVKKKKIYISHSRVLKDSTDGRQVINVDVNYPRNSSH